jgi:hypothetical protein
VALENGLLIADVMHLRLAPKRHFLKHKVYYLCLPFKHLVTLKSRILSLNRFNLFSFYARDHVKDAVSLDEWIADILKKWNISDANGDIVLLTMPRVLGYLFNPVSFWFCLDSQKQLRAVLVEVNNTFNERHCYLCFHEDKRPIDKKDWLESQKIFHVSPFLDVKGEYRLRFAYAQEKIGIWIEYHDGEQRTLLTSLCGKRVPLTDPQLITCFFRYPLVTLKVITLIHYHALRLLLKGIKYRAKPKPPRDENSR